MLSLTVRLTIAPQRVGDFLAAMGANAAASRGEPGCRRFEIHRSLEVANEFWLLEAYDDLAALQAHHAAPHFAAWKARSAGMILTKESWRAELVDG